ncbi:MAG TPA: phosphoglucosamine mutase [Gaiellaceae bacterium]|jgi:phosphoglucosamine mutase|nr:phosphoglucosamine mutase [Gaiellaceae bacterium]
MRRYFGTDGVRGIVGEDLTPDLVERLGRAATLWSKGGRVFVGRDTRGSGPELEEAFARGVVDAGGNAVLAGVLPTPAVALLALDLGVVVSASHNPPEYNGIKIFDRDGQKLTDAAEEEIEALLDADGPGGGDIDRVGVATDSYLEHITERFGSALSGLRVVVDCANGAYSAIAPTAFEQLGAEVTAIAAQPDGSNINLGCGATDLSLLQRTILHGDFDLGVAFDGDGDRMLAVDANGAPVDGDQILAILADDLGVDLVAVTQMTNLGFHRFAEERGIRLVTTDVGDRYVLEALRREGGVLGGEQSGHIIYLKDHVTGDGLAAALLLCTALRGRTLAEAAAVLPRYPQAKENVRVATKKLPDELRAEIERVNAELDGSGRILVRASGTEPVVRVLAEAEEAEKAKELCATITALVTRELG